MTQVKKENAQTKKNMPIDGVDETLLCLELSAEEALFDALDTLEESKQRQKRLILAGHVLDTLTEKQRRRFLKHHICAIPALLDNKSTQKQHQITNLRHLTSCSSQIL